MEGAVESLDVARGDQTYRVAHGSPRVAEGLLVHEAADEGVLAFACRDLEVDTVDVERIVHHILKATVLYGDLPCAGHEVRGIGLGGEVASTARV